MRDSTFKRRARSLVRALRDSQPFNAMATSTVAYALRRLGRKVPDAVANHLIRMGEARCTLPDGQEVRFAARGDDGVTNAVFWRGWIAEETATAPLFYALARRARVIFDIGAHVGYYTILAGAANRDAVVHAFEPLAPVRARLENHVRLNRLANVEVHAEALGATSGEADFFHVDAALLPSSSSLSKRFMDAALSSWAPTQAVAGKNGLKSTRVTVTTVDELVARRQIGRVDLVKIDTETTEPDVLRGMRQTLDRDRPDLICEIIFKEQAEEIALLLAPLGYRCFNLRPEGPVLRSSIIVETELDRLSRSLNWLFTTRDEPSPPAGR